MEQNNYFKFTLNYKGNVLVERIFDADYYNQATRYSIKLQEWNKQIISDFRALLSSYDKDLNFDICGYDLSKCLKDLLKFNNDPKISEMATLDKKTYNEGFSYTLFINNNIIIEREFNLYNFNINSLFSTNLIELVDEWVYRIKDKIKNNDQNQMWEEYDLMNHYGLSLKDVRELPEENRKKMVYKIMKKIEGFNKVDTLIEEIQ